MKNKEQLSLCMVKKVGRNVYSFYFAETEKIMDFYGDNFEQKPAALCRNLEPNTESYEYMFTATAPDDKEFRTSDKSTTFSMQDSLDKCVSLFFDADDEVENRLVLNFGDDAMDVSERLFQYRFELEDIFPVKEPTDFLSEMASRKVDNDDQLRLAFVRLTASITEDGLTRYVYNMSYIKKDRLEEFRNIDSFFDKRQTSLYAPLPFDEFKFDEVVKVTGYNVSLDTIEDQNEYSFIDCMDNCVCLASENIEGKEYPEKRIVLQFFDKKDEVEKLLWDKEFTFD